MSYAAEPVSGFTEMEEGIEEPKFAGVEAHECKTYRNLRAYGLWEHSDNPETPYDNDVELTYYGSRGKRNY